MYSDWPSLTSHLQLLGTSAQSVLCKLPPNDGKQVVSLVVKNVATNLGIIQHETESSSMLMTEAEIAWFMEVICYGLSLPLCEHDTIKDCVNIYCDWLSGLLDEAKSSVPAPVLENPELYARRIFSHLHHLFVPRAGDGQEKIHRQAVLCHRVLRRVQDIAFQSPKLSRETWESLLGFLLSINEALLAPPTAKDDIGDQLCQRVLGVLYEIWLIACVGCFPSPTMWKTLREMSAHWRHRAGLVDQWNRVIWALTARLLNILYGYEYKMSDFLIPVEMSDECVKMTWFRFIHTLGNPVELSRPNLIAQTQAFYQYAIIAVDVIDPETHPCLASLPFIFLKAMQGISALVDAFMGYYRNSNKFPVHRNRALSVVSINESLTGPISMTSQNSTTSTNSLNAISDWSFKLPKNRPLCNSILHLFGKWLFEAAFVNSTYDSLGNENKDLVSFEKTLSDDSLSVKSEQTNTISGDGGAEFELGRAESLGALCRIFCAKKSDSDILPIYLARFYLALQEGLKSAEAVCINSVQSTILMNSTDLFRVDLVGINILLPSFVSILEFIFPNLPSKPQESSSRLSSVGIYQPPPTELRWAAVNILLAILAIPLHYGSLPIKELTPAVSSPKCTVTYISLKSRVYDIVLNALQIETESFIVQQLIGSLSFCVYDSLVMELISEKTDLNLKDQTAEQINYDSAHSLFVRSIQLVCHRLVSSWKSDLSTSLAALELLSGLARINIRDPDAIEIKRAVKWLCEFIVTQCSRPPPAHSKDLHSCIVAAISTCQVWLLYHPYLLEDKDCFSTVLEVVELGISGSKSRSNTSECAILKEDKKLLPASGRVRDAAECLLTSILEQEGSFVSFGMNTYSYNEAVICGGYQCFCRNSQRSESLLGSCDCGQSESVPNFKYFVLDNSILLAFLECPVIQDIPKSKPAKLTLLFRTASGRSVWSFQFRQLPRHKSHKSMENSEHLLPINSGRSLSVDKNFTDKKRSQISKTTPRYFPKSIEKIPTCAADHSIPPLEGDFSASYREKLNDLSEILDQVSEFEKEAVENYNRNQDIYNECDIRSECKPPSPQVQTNQATRIFLSHMGLLDPSDISENSFMPRLVALDTAANSVEFVSELKTLDAISPTTVDTSVIFYVKRGQSESHEIINNKIDAMDPNFMEFLCSLGSPINMENKNATNDSNSNPVSDGGDKLESSSTQNIRDRITSGDVTTLRWSDAFSQLIFLLPNLCAVNGVTSKSNEHIVDKQNPSKNRILHSGCDSCSVVIVWLECFEDNLRFPLQNLMANMTDSKLLENIRIIFIHPLQSGLLRIHTRTKSDNSSCILPFATPLVDGLVISFRCLGSLVRLTVLNASSRRRLDEKDSQFPLPLPSVRRKIKIQDISRRFRSQCSLAEFYSRLFDSGGNAKVWL